MTTQHNNLPQHLGNYRLVRIIGRGGFATVYLGKHIHLGSYAAVKVLHPRLGTAELIEQFTGEARTIAELVHPHIVRVLDFDVQGDLAFLVIEYAPFGALRRQYGSGEMVPLDAVVSYVKQVASALHHAHQHRVIHRDVKPENMLIGQGHQILLSDFGLALLAESTSLQRTRPEAAAGTIAYIAPEQIQGRPRPASDQYALAVAAYEWLCGQRPFHGTLTEVTVQHLSASPQRLRAYNPNISPDVEQVVLRALAKDPTHRFYTVKDFADALEEAAGVEPRLPAEEHFTTLPPATQQAAPDTIVLRSHSGGSRSSRELASVETIAQRQRWNAESSSQEGEQRPRVSRRSVLLGVTTLVTLGGAGLVYANSHSAPTTTVLTPSPQGAMSSTATPTMPDPTAAPTKKPAPTPDPAATQTQAQHPPQNQGAPASNQAPAPAANANTQAEGTLFTAYRGHVAVVYGVAWSPDGGRVASSGADNTAQTWRPADGGTLISYTGHSAAVNYVAWSPGGTRVASASDDKTVHVWNALTGNRVFVLSGHGDNVHSAAYSPHGSRIASGSGDKTVKIWDAATGTLLLTYTEHTATVWVVAWSPDGTRVASASGNKGATIPDNTVKVFDAVSGTTLTTYTGHGDTVFYLSWSPDGRRIASGSADTTVRLWDAVTGTTQNTYRGHTSAVYGVEWSPDGKRIASGGTDATVQVWDARTGTTAYTYRGHTSGVFGVAWSPDGKRIASGSADKTVQVWEA